MDPQTLFAFAAVISGIDLQVEVDGTRVSGEMTVAVELAPPPAELSDPADGGEEAALERMGTVRFPLPPGAALVGADLEVGGRWLAAELVGWRTANETWNDVVAPEPDPVEPASDRWTPRDPLLIHRIDSDLYRAFIFPVLPQTGARFRVRYVHAAPSAGQDPELPVLMPGWFTGHEDFPGRVRWNVRHGDSEDGGDVDDFGAGEGIRFRMPPAPPEDGPDVVVWQGEEPGAAWLHGVLRPGLPDTAGDQTRTTVFVLDVSGSMAGPKIREATRAVAACLATLGPDDRFALLAFGSDVERFSSAPRAATEEALAEARAWLEGQRPGGGTNLSAALLAAFELLEGDDGEGLEVLIATDGRPDSGGIAGQPAARWVADRIREWPSPPTVHAVGIGHDVDADYLRWLIAETGGRAAFAWNDAELVGVVRRLYEAVRPSGLRGARLSVWGDEVRAPAHGSLAGLGPGGSIQFGAQLVADVATPESELHVRLAGRLADGEGWERTWSFAPPAAGTATAHRAAPGLYGRLRAEALSRDMELSGETDDLLRDSAVTLRRFGVVGWHSAYLGLESEQMYADQDIRRVGRDLAGVALDDLSDTPLPARRQGGAGAIDGAHLDPWLYPDAGADGLSAHGLGGGSGDGGSALSGTSCAVAATGAGGTPWALALILVLVGRPRRRRRTPAPATVAIGLTVALLVPACGPIRDGGYGGGVGQRPSAWAEVQRLEASREVAGLRAETTLDLDLVPLDPELPAEEHDVILRLQLPPSAVLTGADVKVTEHGERVWLAGDVAGRRAVARAHHWGTARSPLVAERLSEGLHQVRVWPASADRQATVRLRWSELLDDPGEAWLVRGANDEPLPVRDGDEDGERGVVSTTLTDLAAWDAGDGLTYVHAVWRPDLGEAARGPARQVLFVVEASSTMRDDGFAAATEALRRTGSALAAPDRFAVVAFSDRPRVMPGGWQTWSEQGARSAERWLDAVDPWGPANVELALERAAEVAGDAPGGERVDLVLIMDGPPDLGEQDLDVIQQLHAERLASADPPVRVLGVGMGVGDYGPLLATLAKFTGGRVRSATDSHRLAGVVAELLNETGPKGLSGVWASLEGDVVTRSVHCPLSRHPRGPRVEIGATVTGPGPAQLVLAGVDGEGRPVSVTADVVIPPHSDDAVGVPARYGRCAQTMLERWLDEGVAAAVEAGEVGDPATSAGLGTGAGVGPAALEDPNLVADAVLTGRRFGIVGRYTALVAAKESEGVERDEAGVALDRIQLAYTDESRRSAVGDRLWSDDPPVFQDPGALGSDVQDAGGGGGGVGTDACLSSVASASAQGAAPISAPGGPAWVLSGLALWRLRRRRRLATRPPVGSGG